MKVVGSTVTQRVVIAVVAAAVLALVFYLSESSPGTRQGKSEPGRAAAAPERRPAPVRLPRIKSHLAALERIAEENGGNRAAGTRGYNESVDYVRGVLEELGYEVRAQRFSMPVYVERGPARMLQVSPRRTEYREGRDFATPLYSAAGDVTAGVTPVNYDPAARSRSAISGGCDAEAWAGFPEGDIALVQSGACFAREQLVHAQAVGAAAMIVSYPPDIDTSDGVARSTLIDPEGIEIPVLVVGAETGAALFRSSGRGSSLHVVTRGVTGQRVTHNVIADSPAGGRNVVMAGAHLDSVFDGPGINDNGSGVATLLEVARRFASQRLRNTLRFAFWGGEEYGLVGSTQYVRGLSPRGRRRIGVYLNFDMIGSPNFVRGIYADGPNPKDGPSPRKLFHRFFARRGLNAETIDLGGRSDHGPFLRAGIPVGGLFTGAETPKSARQRRLFGGRKGAPADPCYHLACDDVDNINDSVLKEMAAAAAFVIGTLARRAAPR